MGNAYRNRLQAAGNLVIGLAALGLFVGVGLGSIRARPMIGTLLLLVGLGFAYLFLFRLARVGIYETSNGVKVRQSFQERLVPWSQIQRFGLESRTNWGGYRQFVFVLLENGSRIELSGMGTPAMVEALNERLDKERAGGTFGAARPE